MTQQIVSGITYECDGVSLRASVNDQTYGPASVSDGKRLEDGSVYMVLGTLHVVLTEQAWALLMGWPVPEVAVEDSVVVEEAPVAEVAAPAATSRRGRRKA